jgi:hypothetical protein
VIRYLRHNEIDKTWWDGRIASSHAPLWYALSAVLDAASPGWDALVDDASGAVMPLTHDRKWGMRYLYQPFAVQRLGVFAATPDAVQVGAFLHAVPACFKLWDIMLHDAECAGQPETVVLKERTNMVLELGSDAATLRATYGDSHKRGLRKWGGDGEVCTISPDAFLDIVSGSAQFKQWGITPKQVATLQRMAQVAEAMGNGRFLGLERGGEWLAVGLFVFWGGRIIFLKGLATEAGRGMFALHRIMDSVIASEAGTRAVLDMAGGHAPELRRFYTGFGARPSLYLHAGYNRLPQPLRWIKQRSDGV